MSNVSVSGVSAFLASVKEAVEKQHEAGEQAALKVANAGSKVGKKFLAIVLSNENVQRAVLAHVESYTAGAKAVTDLVGQFADSFTLSQEESEIAALLGPPKSEEGSEDGEEKPKRNKRSKTTTTSPLPD